MGTTKELSDPIAAVVSDPKVQAEVKKMEAVVRVGGLEETGTRGSDVSVASGYEEFKAKTAILDAMKRHGVEGKGVMDEIAGGLRQQIHDDVQKQSVPTAEDRNTVRQLTAEGMEALKKYNEAHPGNEGANPPDVRPTAGKQIGAS
jgi:hypothetical protein